jgi:hypothetical protein
MPTYQERDRALGGRPAHARPRQRLFACQEPDACRIGVGVEVAEHYRQVGTVGDEILDETCRSQRLLLPHMLELQFECASVMHREQRAHGRRSEHLDGHSGGARQALRAVSDGDVQTGDRADWPAAGQALASVTGRPSLGRAGRP